MFCFNVNQEGAHYRRTRHITSREMHMRYRETYCFPFITIHPSNVYALQNRKLNSVIVKGASPHTKPLINVCLLRT